MAATPVYLEVGKKKVFACAVDWPGWARAGRTEEDALEALSLYVPRYAVVTDAAGVRFPSTVARSFDVVERLVGNATTDLGAPDKVADVDRAPVTRAQGRRLASLVDASWSVFADVVAGAPSAMRKGQRGGKRPRWDDAPAISVLGKQIVARPPFACQESPGAHFQPGTLPACLIHFVISGARASSRVFSLT